MENRCVAINRWSGYLCINKITIGVIMPKEMEKKLKEKARKKGLTGKRADAYVYGTMQKKTDWKPGKKHK